MFSFLKKFFSFGLNKDSSSHWIWQRISALIMIFLFPWVIFSFQKLSGNFIIEFNNWIKIPINLVLFITLFVVIMHHSTLGILNIFEDYIHSKRNKKFFSILLKITSLILIFISIFSLCHIYKNVI